MNKSNNLFSTLFLIMLAAVAAISITGVVVTNRPPTVLQGQIEANEVRIAGKLTGRVAEIYVTEGQSVKRGDTLVRIESPEAVALKAEAKAIEEAAAAEQLKVERGTRSEIVAAAKQAWEGAKAQRSLAEKSYARVRNLLLDSVVSRQNADEAEALLRSAEAAEIAAEENYKMAKQGAQKEDKAAAAQMTQAAAEAVARVAATLKDAHLTAPCDGVIIEIYLSESELVSAGLPIMNLVEKGSEYVVVNVKEDLLGQFTEGEAFIAKVPAIGDKEIEFEVYKIAPLGSYATWPNTGQKGSYNMRTFEVKARARNSVSSLKSGMSVLITL